MLPATLTSDPPALSIPPKTMARGPAAAARAAKPTTAFCVPEGIRPKERAREPMPRAMSRTTGAIARWTSMAAVLRAAIACFVWPVSEDSWAAAILLAALRSEVALM